VNDGLRTRHACGRKSEQARQEDFWCFHVHEFDFVLLVIHSFQETKNIAEYHWLPPPVLGHVYAPLRHEPDSNQHIDDQYIRERPGYVKTAMEGSVAKT
jgi:hypothetical protein